MQPAVRIGCGAGFAGDRIEQAAELLAWSSQRGQELDYLVLECLAERTVQDRWRSVRSGGSGYDPRLGDWMAALLPLLGRQRQLIADGQLDKQTVLVTNMGAFDPAAAALCVAGVAERLGLALCVAAVWEASDTESEQCRATYLGADAVDAALGLRSDDGQRAPDVVVTGRVADSSLFVAPVARALGWQLDNDDERLAAAVVAGHLLECGAQLSGGYFYRPTTTSSDWQRHFADVSLPFAELSADGALRVCKRPGSTGELSPRTCKEQLLYEIGDPARYPTPDLVADFSAVRFQQIDNDTVAVRGAAAAAPRPAQLLQLVSTAAAASWKAHAEISYCGLGCLQRADIAVQLVRRWLRQRAPAADAGLLHYYLGGNACSMQPPAGLHRHTDDDDALPEVRLRFDGRFACEEHARLLLDSVLALYTNGPAGGGGITTGIQPEWPLTRRLVDRHTVTWQHRLFFSSIPFRQVSDSSSSSIGQVSDSSINSIGQVSDSSSNSICQVSDSSSNSICQVSDSSSNSIRQVSSNSIRQVSNNSISSISQTNQISSSSSSQSSIQEQCVGRLRLYNVAHARAGDKGDTVNVSLVPYDEAHFAPLLARVDSAFVRRAYRHLIDESTVITVFPVPGICALNIVIDGAILDGGVTTSRRIDRHGKSLSDLLLWQCIEFT